MRERNINRDAVDVRLKLCYSTKIAFDMSARLLDKRIKSYIILEVL